MASRGPLLGSGLIAVILITRSRPGPRLVFNYPAQVDVANITDNDAGREFDTDSDEDDGRSKSAAVNKNRNLSADTKNDVGQHFLGSSIETLEKLLSPGRWSDGKKFEVTVGNVVFVGQPVYAQEDGKWNPNQSDFKDKAQLQENTFVSKMMPATDRKDLGSTQFPGSLDSQLGLSMATSVDSESTTSGVVPDQMNMFHVVFAMRLAKHEHAQLEASAIYHDVARRLSRALQYCQKEHNYVATESRKLAALRAKVNNPKSSIKDLWSQISETSELAWSLKEIFVQISQGSLATFRLRGNEISLQVKVGPRGGPPNEELSPTAAILLLETKESILAELSHSDSAPLAHFVQEHTPTKSLQKHANNLGLSITDVLYLAHHLVKWRKARIISPLHRRNTYIIHPDARLHNLRLFTQKYTLQFPSHLPELSDMLKVLGGRPVRYGQIPPSRDHRTVYMEILAFLVREGLVKQMVTYAWLKVPLNFYAQHNEESTMDHHRPVSAMSLLSPAIRSNVEEDENASVTSERTALPPAIWGTRPHTTTSTTNKRLSDATQVAASELVSAKNDRVATSIDESINIMNPVDPSEKEARLIARLKRSFVRPELREIFTDILPYLDGEHVVEDIAAHLGLKRAQVDECITELEAEHVLAKIMVLADN